MSYFESGKKMSQAEYKMGMLDGESFSWDENGKVLNKAVFEDGRLVR